MPARRVPEWEKEKRAELRSIYGGAMKISDVSTELGVKQHACTIDFLSGLPFIRVGKSVRYDTNDVARRLFERRETP